MATLDRQSDAVVVRIVYDGPPTAGKTTSLRALAQRLGQGQVVTPEESAGRTLYFDWLEYVGGRFEGREIRCQIVSCPGQRALAPRRRLLLDTADAVVFVADTSRDGMPESLRHLDDLHRALHENPLPPGIVLQANKRDLPDAAPLDPLRRSHQLAVVESVASQGEGTREAFVFAVRLALDRVREQLRRGELGHIDERDESAEALLNQMRVLPLDAQAFETWAEETKQPLLPKGSPPRLPDTAVPIGFIWPAINGRILLQEAISDAQSTLKELAPAEWVADTSKGWRFHSSPLSVFPDVDAGRDALIRWAQIHASLAGWLSPDRCIALCETGDGEYRLWQVVRNEQSLWASLAGTLRAPDANLGARLTEAETLCADAAKHWAEAPYELPCTLETVGSIDGCASFVSLVPEPDRARAPTQIDRRARLVNQLQTLVNSELGEQPRDRAG